MKTIFSHININYAEWQYFKMLEDADRLHYLFDIYEVEHQKGVGNIDLSKFFQSVKDTLLNEAKRNEEMQLHVESLNQNTQPGQERVDVMIDDESIMLESNSLRALRFVSNKFIESGYILCRDRNMEKMFRKDKVTRYLRIFKIVDQISSICTN